MKIIEIYRKFSIPPNLQQHMFWVAGVAKFISTHWKGKNLEEEKLIKASLVHDLGNIVKFNFDKYPEFLGKEAENIDFWKNKQKEVIEKYGNDDHLVTEKMLMEIGLDSDSIEVISTKSFSNSVETSNSDNWYLKILLYSDMRVLPLGVCTLEERLTDIMIRMPQYYTRPDINGLLEACRKIEVDIQNMMDCDLKTINQDSINLLTNGFVEFEI